MNQHMIFWPMILQVILTFCVYGLLLNRRIAAVRSGQVKVGTFRGREDGEPELSRSVHNNLANQFELPVLFYAACLALFVTNGVSLFAVVVAWIFALSRIAHAIVHLGANRLSRRQPLFMVGFFSTILLWLALVFQLLSR